MAKEVVADRTPMSRDAQQQLMATLRDIKKDAQLGLDRPEFAISLLVSIRDAADDWLSGRER